MSTRLLFCFALLLLALPACGSDEPFCGAPVDITGRLTVYCNNPRQDPVCNYPGEEPRYEDTAAGLRLVGGELAGCATDESVECPVGTEGPAVCITDPEL